MDGRISFRITFTIARVKRTVNFSRFAVECHTGKKLKRGQTCDHADIDRTNNSCGNLLPRGVIHQANNQKKDRTEGQRREDGTVLGVFRSSKNVDKPSQWVALGREYTSSGPTGSIPRPAYFSTRDWGEEGAREKAIEHRKNHSYRNRINFDVQIVPPTIPQTCFDYDDDADSDQGENFEVERLKKLATHRQKGLESDLGRQDPFQGDDSDDSDDEGMDDNMGMGKSKTKVTKTIKLAPKRKPAACKKPKTGKIARSKVDRTNELPHQKICSKCFEAKDLDKFYDAWDCWKQKQSKCNDCYNETKKIQRAARLLRNAKRTEGSEGPPPCVVLEPLEEIVAVSSELSELSQVMLDDPSDLLEVTNVQPSDEAPVDENDNAFNDDSGED